MVYKSRGIETIDISPVAETKVPAIMVSVSPAILSRPIKRKFVLGGAENTPLSSLC